MGLITNEWVQREWCATTMASGQSCPSAKVKKNQSITNIFTERLAGKFDTFCYFFRAAAFCTVDTDSMPELKPVGKLYFKIGETYRFECAPRREWWFDNYSQFRCKETGATFSRCKYHFNIMTYCSQH